MHCFAIKAQRLVPVTKTLFENIVVLFLDFIYLIFEHANLSWELFTCFIKNKYTDTSAEPFRKNWM